MIRLSLPLLTAVVLLVAAFAFGYVVATFRGRR